MQRATARQLFGIATLASIVAVAAIWTSPEAVLQRVGGLTTPLAIVVVLVGYLVRPLLAWPISALSVLLGYLFGPLAIPIAIGGAVVTTLPPYLLARHFDHDAGVLARVGDTGAALRRGTGDVRGIVVVRLAPLPTDPISYTAGLAGVPLRAYVFGTAIGESPWVISAVLLGASMGRLATDGLSASPLFVGTAFAVAILIALSRPAYRRLADGTAA